MKKNSVIFRNLTVKFGKKIILNKLNFSFNSSNSICVIGEGSSGKTTILKSLIGLVPINEGEIKINGCKINKFNCTEDFSHLNKFGVVFQKDALFDSLTVWQNVMFKKLDLGIPKKELIYQSDKFLRKVGLAASVSHLYPSELSGGMKKRVAISRAVSDKPDYLILDEPTAGLDPVKTNKIFKIIKELSNNSDVSILAITSDMKSALKYFDQLLFLKSNKIEWLGKTKVAKKSKNVFLREILKKA